MPALTRNRITALADDGAWPPLTGVPTPPHLWAGLFFWVAVGAVALVGERGRGASSKQTGAARASTCASLPR